MKHCCLGVESAWARESRGALRPRLAARALIACWSARPAVATRSLRARVARQSFLSGSPRSSVEAGQTVGPVLSVRTCRLSRARQEMPRQILCHISIRRAQ